MIGLIQRVRQARIKVNDEIIAEIKHGIVALIGIEKSDSTSNADHLLHRILGYRIFSDADGKMNLSLSAVKGELLLVPQFTLPADTSRGMRPGFSPAATPDIGKKLFEYLLEQANIKYGNVSTGEFGADMQLNLTNDGPVTFWLEG